MDIHSADALASSHASNSVFSPPGVVNLTRLPSPLSQVPANQLSNVSSASKSRTRSFTCSSVGLHFLYSPSFALDFWSEHRSGLFFDGAHTLAFRTAHSLSSSVPSQLKVQNFAQNSFLALTPPPVVCGGILTVCEAEGNDGLDASQTLRRKTRPPRRTTYPSCNRARGPPPPHSSSFLSFSSS